jgi:DNA primase
MNGGRLTQAELDDIKDRNPVADIARRYVSLRPQGGRLVGPCPICSRDRDSRKAARFEIKDDGWVCAVCTDGGDVIRLVEKVEGLDFNGAVEWLGGAQQVDPVAAVGRDRKRAEKDAKRKADADVYRQRERSTYTISGPMPRRLGERP